MNKLPDNKKKLPIKRTNAWRHDSGAYEMCYGPTPACGAYEFSNHEIARKLRIYEDIKHGDKDLQEALDTHGTMFTNETLPDDYEETQVVNYDEVTPEEAEIIDIGQEFNAMPTSEVSELYDETEFSTDEDEMQPDSQEDVSTDEESDSEALDEDFRAWIAKVSKHNNDHMD